MSAHEENSTHLPDLPEHDCPTEIASRAAPSTSPELDQTVPSPAGFMDGVRMLPEIQGYEVLEEIGRGGMGAVYRARQQAAGGRVVALKVMLGEAFASSAELRRFEREVEIASDLNHASIAHIYDSGLVQGRHYFAMEYVEGQALDTFCKTRDLPLKGRLRLFTAVCEAVAYAHRRGVIHRDLKPSNILVDNEGVPHVLDFGLAKTQPAAGETAVNRPELTMDGMLLGTLPYMAPEQAEGKVSAIDTRTDVYALGVILYELLTGKYPYEVTGQMADVLQRIAEAEPKRPSTVNRLIGDEVETIILRALHKLPDRRYSGAEDFARDVTHFLAGEPIEAKRDSGLYVLRKTVRRYRVPLAFAAAIGVLVCGFAAVSFQLYRKADKARTAEAEQRRLAEAQRDRVLKAEQVAARERDNAREAAELANAKEKEARMTLAASDFMEATRLIEADNGPDAVAYLSRILSSDPDNGAALTRLATLLTYRSWMTPTPGLKRGFWECHTRFSADGKRALKFYLLQFAQVSDAQTGNPISEKMNHGNGVKSARFSLDDRRVVTASSDRTARVWDAQTGKPLTRPLQHESVVLDAVFSPDGRRVVTASADRTARVWDVQTGQPLTNSLKHGDWVNYAEFSPDGQRVVTASADRTARVWDAQTGQPLTGPLNHERGVWDARFSPDGRRVVTASADKTARVWDAQTGQPLTGSLRHGLAVKSTRFDSKGKRLVTADDNTARVWDAETGQPLNEPVKHWGVVMTAKFSDDGKRILTASVDGPAQVWDPQTGPPLVGTLKHGCYVNSAQFSPDSKRIVTASFDQSARVWDAQTGRPLTDLLKHGNCVNYAEFSPDGKRIVTASLDHQSARVWDAQTGRPLTDSLKHGKKVNYAEFSPDGKRIVTASDDDTARVWDAQTGQPLTTPMIHSNGVTSARFSPDGKRIVTAMRASRSSYTGRVWDAETGQPLVGLECVFSMSSARFSPDGKRILTSSRYAQVWDAHTGKLLTQPDIGNWVDAQFSPDGKRIVTASSHRGARVWDAETGQPLTEPLKTGAGVSSAAFSPNGKYIVTASGGMVQMWDALTGQPLTDPLLHGGFVNAAQFSSDSRRIITASADGTARVWDVGFTPAKCPDWLLPLAEALSGNQLNKRGMLEETRLNRTEIIARTRQHLKSQPEDEDGVLWGRWLLDDRSTRTVSPFSKLTVPALLDSLAKESNSVSTNEAQ